jgi:LysM repeat protein
MQARYRSGVSTCAAVAALTFAAPAGASAPHAVQPGETLWSIAAANGLTARTVAVFNGLPEDAQVSIGETIQVPTVEEGEAALIEAGITPGSPTTTTEAAASDPAASGAAVIPPAPGMGHIWSPWGELHLDPAAAESWEAMRQESLATFGVDLYPVGPQSAYRTYEQQAGLYELYLEGAGSPAHPPGSSSHETGTAVDVATPEMRDVIDQIGASYGWAKVEAPTEWWHVNYVGG